MPEIPWTQIVGMRNRLVHACFDINANIVWTTVTQELPTLMQHLREALDQDDLAP